jgi:hypothetical protein
VQSIIKSSNAIFHDGKRRSHSMRIHIPTIYSIITCQTATALMYRAGKTSIVADRRSHVNAPIMRARDVTAPKGREEYPVGNSTSSGR